MAKLPNNPLLEELINLANQRPRLHTNNTSWANDIAVDDNKHSNQQTYESELSRIIEMAWEDRTPFEAIEHQYGLSEAEVITIMRQHLHRKSFKLWRQRVTGRTTKHRDLRSNQVTRAYCPTQYKHHR